jgi:hypothetical protein
MVLDIYVRYLRLKRAFGEDISRQWLNDIIDTWYQDDPVLNKKYDVYNFLKL